ncbi:ATP-binding protein [candidate division KSB1 bacterium]|nr:ATP-binding protein [candidate division KSB1 bacterium]
MGVHHKKVPLKNKYTEIERLQKIVTNFCQHYNIPAEILFHLNVVLDEMVTNVISYAWCDNLTHHFNIYLEIKNGLITATIEDDGKPFNPLLTEKVDVTRQIEERPIGGLGIHLAKTMMDCLEYKYQKNKNILTIKKRVKK